MKKKILIICLATTIIFSSMSVSATSLATKQVVAKNSTAQEAHIISNNDSDSNKKTTGTANDEKTKYKTTIDGLGTILFTFAGIVLMAGAVVAMKRNREEC